LEAKSRPNLGRFQSHQWFAFRAGSIARNDGRAALRRDDEYLVDLARDAGADALVTGDAHLLDLRPIIPAMTPAEFLATLPDR
jgi:predicted nucleic acid-binding protein